MRLVLIFSISTVAYSGTNLLFVQQQQQVFLPLLQPAQEQTAYAFHTQALKNMTSHAIQVVESVEQNLNATREALLNANITDAFFHLGVARHDLSVLNQGNATIGMYAVFPHLENPSLLGASPPGVTSSSPPAVISSSPPSFSSSISSPTGSAVTGGTATGATGAIIDEESSTTTGQSESTESTQPTQAAQSPQHVQPNQPFQTFQPSIPSQGSQASQGSLPSQSFTPSQPTQPTRPTQPTQPSQPIIPGQPIIRQ